MIEDLKAKDLRLGNLYQYLHEEDITYQIVDIDFLKYQEMYDEDPDADEFSRGWWATGIPITEELLDKLRIKKDIEETLKKQEIILALKKIHPDTLSSRIDI